MLRAQCLTRGPLLRSPRLRRLLLFPIRLLALQKEALLCLRGITARREKRTSTRTSSGTRLEESQGNPPPLSRPWTFYHLPRSKREGKPVRWRVSYALLFSACSVYSYTNMGAVYVR